MVYTAAKLLTDLRDILPPGRTLLPSRRRKAALHVYTEHSGQQ